MTIAMPAPTRSKRLFCSWRWCAMLLVGASVLPSCAPVKEEPRTPAPAPAPAIQVVAPAAAVDAVKTDPAAWGALAGIDTHSYNMAATERAAAYVEGPDGRNRLDYWMTEASDNGPEDPGMTGVPALRAASLAARFGRKPHLLAATAQNPDGTWSIGIQNYTADSFSGSQGAGG
jgi:hypothetical protein